MSLPNLRHASASLTSKLQRDEEAFISSARTYVADEPAAYEDRRTAFMSKLFGDMERREVESLERRAEEALGSEEEPQPPPGVPTVKCVYCCEAYAPAQNHGGACFGHQPDVSRSSCDVKYTRRYKLSPHGSVWTLDCCGKWFGSGSPDTPAPYPPIHANDLLQGGGRGECFRGICPASLRRGVGAGPHLAPSVAPPGERDDPTREGEPQADVQPARRATVATLAALQARYAREDRQLTKEECIAELCEEDEEEGEEEESDEDYESTEYSDEEYSDEEETDDRQTEKRAA